MSWRLSARVLKTISSKQNLKPRHFICGFLAFAFIIFGYIRVLNLSPYQSHSQLQYFRATAVKVSVEQSSTEGIEQIIQARLLDGPAHGQLVTVNRGLNFGDSAYKRLPVGSEILLTKDLANGNQYSFYDRWRLPGVATLIFLLLSLVVVVGWWRGITSAIGLITSIAILFVFVIPRIVSGHPPFATCIEGAFLITAVSIFIAHGFSRRTTIAFVSSLITLLVVVGLVGLATYLTGTSEVLSEDTASLIYGPHAIGLASLLTGGIVITSLGVLYDITTGQAAAVDELHKANKRLGPMQLYRKGLSVGREHIAALVNTLVLVYVGIALPVIIINTLYMHLSLIVAINDESVVEEIVRTGVASLGLLTAVPITTGLAAYLLPKWYRTSAKELFSTIMARL